VLTIIPYGGGSGMVMTIQPFAACIEKLKSEREYDEVIFMSPDGETLNQNIANQLSIKKNIIILCGHYKGIDQRIRDIYVTREISHRGLCTIGRRTARSCTG
jgi:tRNA (guanine37-N1)-methyltransferase